MTLNHFLCLLHLREAYAKWHNLISSHCIKEYAKYWSTSCPRLECNRASAGGGGGSKKQTATKFHSTTQIGCSNKNLQNTFAVEPGLSARFFFTRGTTVAQVHFMQGNVPPHSERLKPAEKTFYTAATFSTQSHWSSNFCSEAYPVCHRKCKISPKLEEDNFKWVFVSTDLLRR